MTTTTPTAQQQLHKAVCDLIAFHPSERLEHEVAVALRRWYLENNCFHPEDSAPMDSMFCGIDEWMALNDAIGGQGSDVDQQARADWSAHRICRALAEACNNIVEHAYPVGDTIKAMIGLDIADDRGGLQITLRDRGLPMPDGQLPGIAWPAIDPDDPLTLPEGGFGWPLLRGMAQALCLSRQSGQNILRFHLPRIATHRQ